MSEPRLSHHLLLDYLTELGSALMSAGCPTYRLEELLSELARLEGHAIDVFAVPTGLFVGVRTPEGEPSALSLVRVTEWKTDLDRLARLDEVFNQVADRTISVDEARARIRAISHAKPTWSVPMLLLAGFGASAGSVVSLGGGASDFLIAGLGGFLLRLVIERLRQRPGVRFLENFIGGAVAGLLAWFATLLWPTHSREVLVLAIVIQLLPGMMLTTALAELTYKNLIAGSARLMDAAVTLLSLVFGIAMVLQLESALGFHAAIEETVVPASWPWQWLSVLAASLSFGVLLGLRRAHLGVAVTSGGLVAVMGWAVSALPSAQSSFLTAMVLAMSANLYTRVKQRPAQLFLLPGLLLLVPGAFALLSFEALLRGDYARGADRLVDVLLVAGALVMGLLVANVVVAPRKIL